MKKLLLVAALGAAGLMSANERSKDVKTVDIAEKTTTDSYISINADLWCQWCVIGNGNQYCAEASDCATAKAAARAMAMSDQSTSTE